MDDDVVGHILEARSLNHASLWWMMVNKYHPDMLWDWYIIPILHKAHTMLVALKLPLKRIVVWFLFVCDELPIHQLTEPMKKWGAKDTATKLDYEASAVK
jgi:hypothetical protein